MSKRKHSGNGVNGGGGGRGGMERVDHALLADPHDSPVVTEYTDPEDDGGLRYILNQIPPIPVMVFIALQHVLVCLPGSLTMSAVIADTLCVDQTHPVRAKLFANTLAMSGVCTILQTVFGVRLPVFQGPSSSFLVPLIAMARLPSWQCPDPSTTPTTTTTTTTISSINNNATSFADTSVDFLNATADASTSVTRLTMEEKLQELSGSLMLASLVEIAVGSLGLVRPLMRLIGPLTVAATISLIGMSMFKLPVVYSKHNPLVALGSFVLVLVFSLYMAKVRVPLPSCGKGGKRSSLQPFQLFPILLAIVVMWGVCGLLTLAGAYPDDPAHPFFLTRTDARISIIKTTPWLQVPYPGQFGLPSINMGVTIGFSSAVLASLVESVGDYFAAARCCKVGPPPNHAISRGILMEGLGSLLSGAIGAAHATTSYSGNIAMLSLTKTASRSVLVLAGFIIIGVSLVGKVGASMAILPPPILGGILIVVMAMLTSLGLSTLTYCDMTSNRNLLIIGTSLMVGFSFPAFVETHGDMLATGNASADQAITIVLGTPMFLGGIVALVLDNTVPGTDAERGMLAWTKSHQGDDTEAEDDVSIYDENIIDDVNREDDYSKPDQSNGKTKTTFAVQSAELNATKSGLTLERKDAGHKTLRDEDVYGFACLKGRLGHRFWRHVPFLPHDPPPRPHGPDSYVRGISARTDVTCISDDDQPLTSPV